MKNINLTKKHYIVFALSLCLLTIIGITIGIWFYSGLLPKNLYLQEVPGINIVHTNARCGTIKPQGITITPRIISKENFFREKYFEEFRTCGVCFNDRQFERYEDAVNEATKQKK